MFSHFFHSGQLNEGANSLSFLCFYWEGSGQKCHIMMPNRWKSSHKTNKSSKQAQVFQEFLKLLTEIHNSLLERNISAILTSSVDTNELFY